MRGKGTAVHAEARGLCSRRTCSRAHTLDNAMQSRPGEKASSVSTSTKSMFAP